MSASAAAWGAWSGEPWLWAALGLAGGLVLLGVRNLWRHARVGAGVPIGILLHEDEAGLDVPTEPHDRRVTHLVTPAGVTP